MLSIDELLKIYSSAFIKISVTKKFGTLLTRQEFIRIDLLFDDKKLNFFSKIPIVNNKTMCNVLVVKKYHLIIVLNQ